MNPKKNTQVPSLATNGTSIPVRVDSSPIPRSQELISAEIEHDIPVISHPDERSKSLEESNPIAAKKQFNQESGDDPELEHVLKDVNQKVKEEAQKDGSKKRKLFAKPKTGSPSAKKPILTTLAAILIAGGLVAAAVYAYNSDIQQEEKARVTNISAVKKQPDTAAEATTITPGDLTDLSTALEDDTKAMNDAQDFNTAELSDESLGLQ